MVAVGTSPHSAIHVYLRDDYYRRCSDIVVVDNNLLIINLLINNLLIINLLINNLLINNFLLLILIICVRIRVSAISLFVDCIFAYAYAWLH